jgi:hypothetical protein
MSFGHYLQKKRVFHRKKSFPTYLLHLIAEMIACNRDMIMRSGMYLKILREVVKDSQSKRIIVIGYFTVGLD